MKSNVAPGAKVILLLTTDPRVVIAVREAAVKEGYKLLLLQDPIPAYYQIRGNTQPIDLVLLDLDPGMQAVALLSVTLDRVPVVVLTSQPRLPTVELFRHRGAEHSLTKPFSPSQLVEAIKRALARKAMAG